MICVKQDRGVANVVGDGSPNTAPGLLTETTVKTKQITAGPLGGKRDRDTKRRCRGPVVPRFVDSTQKRSFATKKNASH